MSTSTNIKWADVTWNPAEVLDRPLHWRKPRRVLVNSMSDLFHEDVTLKFIDHVVAIMSLAKNHTFQILTKRPKRMRDYFVERVPKNHRKWPLPNVWLGVSVEDQRTSDERIPFLLQIPASVRFVSCKPLLGPVDLEKILGGAEESRRVLNGWHGIDWIVTGGETGPRARPTHPEWVRSLRNQCEVAGVPFWFEGWGEWREACPPDDPIWNGNPPKLLSAYETHFVRLGKKAAGRMLDGREWNEIP